MMVKRILILFIVLFFSCGNYLFAAEANQNLWTTGKIYVVLTVLATIFTGIIIFLLLVERKISRLEKKISEK